MVNQAEKTALLTHHAADRRGRAGAGVQPHQAWRRQDRPHARGRRHPRQRDPRQQEPAAARARDRGVQVGPDARCWSRPTSPRAGSTSRASATSSISTCPKCRSNMSTASAAPRAPAPTASRSRSAPRGARQPARHRADHAPEDRRCAASRRTSPPRPRRSRRLTSRLPAHARRAIVRNRQQRRTEGAAHRPNGQRRQDRTGRRAALIRRAPKAATRRPVAAGRPGGAIAAFRGARSGARAQARG